MENVPTCPLCGSAARQPFDQRTFRNQPVSNLLCRNCGLVYQSPRMSPAELDAFYIQEYRLLYQGEAGPNPKDLAVQNERAAAMARFIETYRSSFRRHLDFGCSAGALLQEFRVRFGSQPVGIEPGEAYRNYTAALGIRVYASLESLQAGTEEAFDLISLAHVLEHLADPVASLRQLRETALAPDGLLLVEVPNLYTHDCFEIAHLVSYSAHTLRQTLEQAGYRVLRLEAHGRPRSEILPLYLTALAAPLANPTNKPVEGESFVSLKRRLGMLRRRILTRLQPSRAWLKTQT